uniref:Fructose-2,6-bisphosphatase TIGAR B n=1 Tax=Cyprinodon variegatus TaxID=28743 RepID=A0A3Q2CW00_CYPVA
TLQFPLTVGQEMDMPLSETGVQQGEAVGKYLRDVKFSKVFVSNLQRAVQTAELILKNNTHCSGMEMVSEPLLRERGFGVAEGRHKEDMKNMANAAGQSCRDYTPPGGETLDQVKLRFKNFRQVLFKEMLDMSGSSGQETPSVALSAEDAAMASADLQGASAHVLVVSHGAYIRVTPPRLLITIYLNHLLLHKRLSPCGPDHSFSFSLTLMPKFMFSFSEVSG